ncbi:MAG: hypothetical protein OEW90_05000 [Betaproteobacteria bacterium]|nr:hypothetical protein [Betaproteobacteria bacterium]MDH4323477.1 hypothetical protein [Betaproteobacteria bacterium]
MTQYSKLITSLVGLALMLLHQNFGVDLTGQAAPIVDLILAALTAFGVYQVRNAPSDGASSQGGFVRLELLALVAAMSMILTLPACKSFTEPVHGVTSTESKAVAAARNAIDEANVLLASVNKVIGDNAAAGVWTKAQAQGWLDETKAAGKKVGEARELLRAGLVVDAQTQAEAIRRVILAIQKRIAAEARKP